MPSAAAEMLNLDRDQWKVLGVKYKAKPRTIDQAPICIRD